WTDFTCFVRRPGTETPAPEKASRPVREAPVRFEPETKPPNREDERTDRTPRRRRRRRRPPPADPPPARRPVQGFPQAVERRRGLPHALPECAVDELSGRRAGVHRFRQ